MTSTHVHVPVECELIGRNRYADAFNEVEVDVLFHGPDGRAWRVPAFWAGENAFRARFAAPDPGEYTWESTATRTDDPGLHGRTGGFTAEPYDGPCALYLHGRLRLAASQRTLAHADGAPFAWLGDTWWAGCIGRFGWPEDFRRLTADRVEKGFTLVQLVAGMLPWCAGDPAGHPAQGNEGGLPWEAGWKRLNPAYYDRADIRIAHLVEAGLVPCIFAMWGHHLLAMGVENAKRHWRNLVARYGAYPVVWCLAGEAILPARFDKREDWDADVQRQRQGWLDVLRTLRAMDPFKNPITAHPPNFAYLHTHPHFLAGGHDVRASYSSRTMFDDPGDLFDVDMLQTGHAGYRSLASSTRMVAEAARRTPPRPVIQGEVCYENIMGASNADVQRFLFWSEMLGGAAGFTYGAMGIWDMNSRRRPTTDGAGWGEGFWEDAMHLPGSAQLGVGRRLLDRYAWWELRPCSEPCLPDGHVSAYSAAIPGKLKLVYFPVSAMPDELLGMMTNFHGLLAPIALEPGRTYRVRYLNPRTGDGVEAGEATADAGGLWKPPAKPNMADWVLALEAKGDEDGETVDENGDESG